MKGDKSTETSSLSQISKWDVNGPSLNEGVLSSPRNPSLHVSTQSADEENPGLGKLGWSDEEHRQRLTNIGENVEVSETVSLSIDELNAFRAQFPVVLDGDEFEIIY